MNERIRELLEQAGYKPLPGFDFANSLDEVFMQKFAELIVQEMCNVLDKAQWDIGRDWICDDGMRIIPKVKQHFGVE